ncbi:MAG: DUF4143 domain-containing protein [Bacteroidia bacterium]|nr:DUF4143 domain-containing protein [Bacteroidia bacterium]
MTEKAINELLGLYTEYCITGGYPAIVLETDLEKKEKKLKQIINTYLKADLRDIGKIRNLQKFNNFLEIIASQTGNLLNISELSITTGIAKQTVEEYLFILENTYIIKLIHPYYNNLRSELTKMPKIYFEDTGIASILENKNFLQKVSGKIFETSVFSELRKTYSAEHLYFWKTNNNQEIDFILNKKKLIPIEVKISFFGKDITSLKYFKEKYNIKKAFIITLNKKVDGQNEWLNIIYPWDIKMILKNITTL